MPTPERTPCPHCSHVGLDLARRWVANPRASLAGVQAKATARHVLMWSCPHCEASGPAEVDT